MKKALEILAQLFQFNQSIDKVFESVASGIDKLNLTDQEKAEGVKQFIVDSLSENTVRSKTRRFIAKFIVLNFIAAFWVCVFMVKKEPEFVENIIELVQTFKIGFAFLAVITFHFGGYYLNGKKKKEVKHG